MVKCFAKCDGRVLEVILKPDFLGTVNVVEVLWVVISPVVDGLYPVGGGLCKSVSHVRHVIIGGVRVPGIGVRYVVLHVRDRVGCIGGPGLLASPSVL